MYDFFLGSREEIASNETKFLIAVKRMMPRWVNSVPDTEFLSLAALLDEQGRAAVAAGRRFVVAETGAGASSLACAYYALKYGGLALSWDYNGEKGSLIRTVCTETMGNVFAKHVDTHWKLIAHDSLSPYLGLAILPGLVDHVDLFFHDSEHTWNTVLGELRAVNPLLIEGAVVALDDANQDYLHTNIAYINTFRRKLALPPVPRQADNTSLPFYQETERFLQANWTQVDYLPDLYKQNFRNDPYFAYYDAEFDIKVELGTERLEKLEHRFDSWRVSQRGGKGGKP
jgi:hypothetical protein